MPPAKRTATKKRANDTAFGKAIAATTALQAGGGPPGGQAGEGTPNPGPEQGPGGAGLPGAGGLDTAMSHGAQQTAIPDASTGTVLPGSGGPPEGQPGEGGPQGRGLEQGPPGAGAPGLPGTGPDTAAPAGLQQAEGRGGVTLPAAAAPAAAAPVQISLPAPETNPNDYRERTNDGVPRRVNDAVKNRRLKSGKSAAVIVATAVSKAYQDGVLPGLVEQYKARGSVATIFGTHQPKKQSRATSPVRLNYNPTPEEFRGYNAIAAQLDISRAVLITLSLAYYFGMPDPAGIA